MVRTGDSHPACEGGGIGGYFIETDEKDKKGSGDQKIAKKKAFADEESAGNHEQDADDLKGEAKVINANKGDNKTAEKEQNVEEVFAGEHF